MKMVNKNVVGMLVKSLERDGVELLLLAVTFLKKLSMFRREQEPYLQADLNVVEKVSKLVPCENPDLLNATLRLLLNLSFDSELRGKMIKVGLLPKLVSLIHSKHRVIVLSILYHISMDDRCKSLFTYTDCIPIVMKLVMDCEEEHAEIELLALCANLAANRRNAQLMCEAGGGLRLLMRRAFRFKDCLLMKVVRSVAQHDGPTRNLFVEYVSDLANAVVRCDSEDFIIEVLGCLANLVIADLDYELLLREYELVPWLRERLRPGAVDDDLIMECVLLVSTCCSDDQCATMLANEGFVTALVDLLHAKQEDDEFVCQLMHCCYRLVRHPQTRARVLRTHAPDYMLDLMFDPNPVVRSVVNDTLEIIAEHDETWAKKIQSERFRHHNENWLDMVESRQAEDTAHDMYGEDEIGPYLQEGMLDRPDLFYGEGHDSVTLQGDGNLSPDYVVDEVFSNGGAAEFLGHHAYPRSEFEVDDQYDRPMNPFGQPTVPGYGVSNLEGSFVDRF
ncbi:PREDICTED: kinesin-associated protein 3-like [Priapulus caudatus]|uniref:Kinesin-associated protein 3-like n=1 Tax=Priapulus caudatus TaxID=37621 RepID=A0ABM1EW01_PRICU|nr:PREDICTED: kinesin-associated protein 3-like [Priapulus caudatus]